MTAPGIGWVLGYTIAAEIGDIARFASPTKLAGYTGGVPAGLPVRRQGPPRTAGPQRTQVPALGADRGGRAHRPAPDLCRALPAHQDPAGPPARPKVAHVDLARRLAEAIWHMLTTDRPFAPAGAAKSLAS
jgi:transposase